MNITKGKVHTELIDENGSSYGIKQIDNKPRVSAVPYLYDISKGNVANHDYIHKFGYNGDIDAAEEAIWTVGGSYTYLTSAEQLKIVSTSDADSDTGGVNPQSTGARTIIIYGLDSNWDEQNETITLDGTTTVTSTSSFLRVLRAYTVTAGSGGKNAGTISIKNNAANNTLAEIAIGRNQTEMAIWTVPNGKTAYIVDAWFGESNNKKTEARLYIRTLNGVFRVHMTIAIIGNSILRSFSLPYPLAAKTDIELRAESSVTNASVSGGFEGWYES